MTTDDIERRAAVELRAAGRRLVGYAAIFDTAADIGGAYTEVVRRGAFAKSLAAGADILALVDHDRAALLGRTRTQTLRLREDGRGLAFEIDLPSTSLANDLLALAERGDLGGGSFGFLVPKGGERWSGRTRELTEIDLREISIVHSWPAYAGTEVAARARASGEAANPALLRERWRFL